MINGPNFTLKFLAKGLLIPLRIADRFCRVCEHSHRQKRSQVLRIISTSIVLLILLSSCTMQPTPISELPSSQPTFSIILGENATYVSPIKQWRVYDLNALAWSMDSSAFAVAGKEKSDDVNFGVYAYDIDSSNKLWFSESYVPFSLAYSPDNQVVAVPSLGLSLLDATNGKIVKKVPYLNGCVGSQEIKYNSNGSTILTLGTDPDFRTTTIYMWDADTDQCLGALTEEQGVAFNFEVSRDSRFLVLSLRDIGKDLEQQVHIWNIETPQLTCAFEGAQPVAFTLDGGIIAAGSVDSQGDVDLWDAKTCQLLDTLHRQGQKGLFSMDFSPDGKLLVAGSSDAFQIWNVADRKLLFESEKLPNIVKMLAFSPDGRFLLSETDRISVDDQATITLWGVSQ